MATAALNGTGLRRINRQLDLGRRWLACGWRLVRRDPWLLGGMGLSASVIITLLSLIPYMGPLLIALLAPALTASALVAIDGLARRRTTQPSRSPIETLRRAPLELVTPFRDAAALMPAAAAGVYGLIAALLIQTIVYLLAAGAWLGEWTALDAVTLASVVGVALLAVTLYLTVAVSLLFALPLVLLQDEPVVPAVQHSLRAGIRYPFAVVSILAVALAPFLAGAVAALGPAGTAGLVTVATGSLALPVAVSSAYCSYRTLFPLKETPPGG